MLSYYCNNRLNFAGFVYREDLSQPQGLVFVKEV
ncbi:protein YaaA [Streptococcus pneumoniae]|nr:protein YaaA [Streptococcus pneumoniae]